MPLHPASKAHGFALVIALSLMAFVLLLLLSISTFVRIESQVAAVSKERLEARQDALLALNIAVGELQKLTGPDSRSTASASLFDDAPASLPVIGVEHPSWVGVWDSTPSLGYLNRRFDTSDPYFQYGARRDGTDNRFLGWLVSGNNDDIADRDRALTAVEAHEILDLGGAGVLAGDSGGPVNVRKVNIDPNDPSQGRYAYWISDESQKVALDAFRGVAPSDSLERSRFMINQRSALEKMSADAETFFGPLGIDWPADKAIFFSDVEGLVSGVTPSNSLEPYDSVTSLNSNSLLTSSLGTGLRADLSGLIRGAGGSLPYQGVPAFRNANGYELVKYPSGTGLHPTPLPPTWEQLISYSRNTVLGSQALAIRKHSRTEHGIYPVVARYRFDMIPQFERSTSPGVGDRFFMNLAPVVVLLNPYNAAISIPEDTYVNLYFEKRDVDALQGLFIGNEWVKRHGTPQYIEIFDGNPPSTVDQSPYGNPDVHNFLDNGSLHEFVDPTGAVYVGFTFRLPAAEMPAGALVAFGVADATGTGEYDGSNELEVGIFDTNPTFVRLYNQNENGIELRAHPEWSARDSSNIPAGDARPNNYREAGALQINTDAAASHSDPSRLLPFNVGVGLSDTPTPTSVEDFYHLATGIQCASPNVNMRFVNTLQVGRNFRLTSSDPYLDVFEEMTRRSLRFDVVLGGGGPFVGNDQSGADFSYGYLINSRWLVGHRLNAPLHIPSAVDDLQGAPNTLYGAVASYAPGAYDGTVNMHVPTVETDASGERAYWGTGLSADTGTDRVSFFDLPRETVGVLSLGYLQHMITSETSSAHAYGIGTGVASLKIDDTGLLVASRASPNALPATLLPVDESYLLNVGLFDTYFFTGLNRVLDQSDIDQNSALPLNERYRYAQNATADVLNNPLTAAKNLYLRGGFNVNSTKVESWKALLAGANQVEVELEGLGTQLLTSPVSRSGFPLAGSGSSNDELLNGFRELDDPELDALANGIVREVKERGPFFSIADFVNRRVVSGNSDDGLYGVIESALRIDAAGSDKTSEVNESVITAGGASELSTILRADNLPSGRVFPDTYNQDVFEGHHADGIQQWVSQADVLQRIAHLLVARSDTFTVYAYGERVDPVSQQVTSTALCEAVIQRQYFYIDETANSPEDSRYVFDNALELFREGNLSQINERFGRRYTVKSIRWLD